MCLARADRTISFLSWQRGTMLGRMYSGKTLASELGTCITSLESAVGVVIFQFDSSIDFKKELHYLLVSNFPPALTFKRN